MTGTTDSFRLIILSLIYLLANNGPHGVMGGLGVIELSDTQEIFAWEGQRDLLLTCKVYPGNAYTFVNVTHLHPITGEERLLGRLDSGVVVGLADGYNLTYSMTLFYRVTVTLTVTEVGGADDGGIKFEAFSDTTTTSGYTQPLTAIRNVTVVRNVTSVDVRLPEVTGCQGVMVVEQDGPIDVIAGEYEVTCAAKGSNPAITNFTLFLDGRRLDLVGDPQIQLVGTNGRRFDSQVSAAANLTDENASYTLECRASFDYSYLPGPLIFFSISKVVRAVNSATTPLVSVACDQTRALSDDKEAELICRIRHLGKGTPSYRILIEPSGQTISEENAGGLVNASLNVTCLSSSRTEVRLVLHSLKPWHLESAFYMLVNITGNVTRERIHLTRVDDADDDDGGCSHGTRTDFSFLISIFVLCYLLLLL